MCSVYESHWAVVIYMHGVHLHTGLKQQGFQEAEPLGLGPGSLLPFLSLCLISPSTEEGEVCRLFSELSALLREDAPPRLPKYSG